MGAAAASMPLSSSAREYELSLIETQRYRDFVKLTHTPFPRSHKNSAYWSRGLLRGGILERTPAQ